ncbi:hypothetical protein TWF970_004206 [Orbilia oligospora]|uniref:Uncharacterized protein n=1 Tax=Orbilia oligospora TaxID=2813651 RepID=A0A7C8VAU9_ORBOL|nr:hypothetical protein TWF970_004206 [Orbilia oligospora]
MSNLPAANVICNLQDYTWSRGDIVNALWQAYDCVERVSGNTCTNSATHYPHGYYNQNPPVWRCGGQAAAVDVQEFPVLANKELYSKDDPGLARVYASLSLIIIVPEPPQMASRIEINKMAPLNVVHVHV